MKLTIINIHPPMGPIAWTYRAAIISTKPSINAAMSRIAKKSATRRIICSGRRTNRRLILAICGNYKSRGNITRWKGGGQIRF